MGWPGLAHRPFNGGLARLLWYGEGLWGAYPDRGRRSLWSAGWQRRVALMSIDDSEWAELASMTTVRQPTYTIGERAVEFLHERIEGAVVAARECLLPGELVVRASTASSTNNRGT